MLKVGIVGGQLQGMEAVYLSKLAGYEVTLIDKDPLVPARQFVDDFYNIDLLADGQSNRDLLSGFDLIIPATENYATLIWLNEAAHRCDVPLALDMSAYEISSSKIRSNKLFSRVGISMPEVWPECGFPVIVKPSGLSGSAGVIKVVDQAHLAGALNNVGNDVVIQKYLDGPSYSLEVLAHQGKSVTLQITQLEFDSSYDCKRVLAGPNIGDDVANLFYRLSEHIAAEIELSGIMDIEVIYNNNELKVLEIDARIPSQTPSAVYHSTGVNMVKLIAQYWIEGKLPVDRQFSGPKRSVIYEHLIFKEGKLSVSGEHILVGAQNLKVYHDKFSTNVLIANFEESPEEWVATAIFVEDTGAQVWQTRNRAIKIIQQAFKAKSYFDPSPFVKGGGEID